MYRQISKLLLVLTLLTFPELVVTTGKFFFGLGFYFELLAGVTTALVSAGILVSWAEMRQELVLMVSGLLATISSLALMLASAGVSYFSILLSGQAWMVSASTLMAFLLCFPLGVLLGKLDHNPAKLVT